MKVIITRLRNPFALVLHFSHKRREDLRGVAMKGICLRRQRIVATVFALALFGLCLPGAAALPTPEASICLDFNAGAPTGLRLFGDARVDSGRLKLYTVGQPNSFGIAYIDDFNGGQPVASFRATFKAALFGSTCCGAGFFPAD